jgi:hypothetical protein
MRSRSFLSGKTASADQTAMYPQPSTRPPAGRDRRSLCVSRDPTLPRASSQFLCPTVSTRNRDVSFAWVRGCRWGCGRSVQFSKERWAPCFRVHGSGCTCGHTVADTNVCRYAKATFCKDRRLNFRLSSKDLEAIQKRAPTGRALVVNVQGHVIANLSCPYQKLNRRREDRAGAGFKVAKGCPERRMRNTPWPETDARPRTGCPQLSGGLSSRPEKNRADVASTQRARKGQTPCWGRPCRERRVDDCARKHTVCAATLWFIARNTETEQSLRVALVTD